MYGVPEDLPLGRFVGDFLTRVSLGMDGALPFWEVRRNLGGGKVGTSGRGGSIVDQSMEHADRNAYRHHVIFNADVTAYRIDPPRSFAPTFGTGHVLTVYDDTPQYESDGIHV